MISFTNISGAEEIGANCYLLEMDGTRIVLDSGMHPKKEGKAAMPDFDSLEPNSVEAVFLSHSHLDHLGTLPVLQEKQPAAEVFMTPAAAALSEVMLHNSVNVMSAKRLDLGIVEYPFFTHNDLDRLSDAWHAKSCNEVFRVGFRQNVLATFYDAGHILGSAGVMLETAARALHNQRIYAGFRKISPGNHALVFKLHVPRVKYGMAALALQHHAGRPQDVPGIIKRGHTVFYTGDVQFEDQSMIPGADFPESGVDTLVMECTRGGFQRSAHYSRPEEMVRFGKAIAETLERGGAVLIPVFAIGKSQEMLFNIHRFKQQGVIPANTPVYFGGLSAKVSLLYDRFAGLTRRHDHEFKLKEEIQTVPLPRKGKAPLVCSPGNIYVVSSGMMTENTLSNVMAEQVLPQERNAILFVGYADPDSPAGLLKATPEGELVKMRPNGQPVRRKCTVDCFDFSGHATRDSLVNYAVKLNPRQVVLVHGDPDAVEWMHHTLSAKMPDSTIVVPEPGRRYTFEP